MTGRPLAWVAGYTMSSAVWKECWTAIPDRHHVGIDLPGHGTESGTTMPRTLAGWATHVVERMQTLGARDLVGLSFGSSIALQVALDHPGEVDRLVLAAPTLSGRVLDPDARTRYMTMARARARGISGRAMADLWMTGPPDIFTGLRRFSGRFEKVAEDIAEHSFTELSTGAMATLAMTRQESADLRRLTPRVLVLSGEQDMAEFRENATIITDHAPNATLVDLPDSGHLPLLEEPVRSAGHVEAFLRAA